MSVNAKIVENVLRREGERFVVELRACSKYGITRETLADWRGQVTTCEDVRKMTRDEAVAIYLSWMERHRLDVIGDPSLRDLVFDCAVNHGPARAIRWLQRALGVEDDGVIGEKTTEALDRAQPKLIYCSILRRRLQHYGRLISADTRQAIYAEGWLARASEFVR